MSPGPPRYDVEVLHRSVVILLIALTSLASAALPDSTIQTPPGLRILSRDGARVLPVVNVGNQEYVPLDEVAGKLKAMAKDNLDEQVFVRGDKGVDYGDVLRVMGRINAGGFRKISLVSEAEDGG